MRNTHYIFLNLLRKKRISANFDGLKHQVLRLYQLPGMLTKPNCYSWDKTVVTSGFNIENMRAGQQVCDFFSFPPLT